VQSLGDDLESGRCLTDELTIGLEEHAFLGLNPYFPGPVLVNLWVAEVGASIDPGHVGYDLQPTGVAYDDDVEEAVVQSSMRGDVHTASSIAPVANDDGIGFLVQALLTVEGDLHRLVLVSQQLDAEATEEREGAPQGFGTAVDPLDNLAVEAQAGQVEEITLCLSSFGDTGDQSQVNALGLAAQEGYPECAPSRTPCRWG
jgi:hypothetical protein